MEVDASLLVGLFSNKIRISLFISEFPSPTQYDSSQAFTESVRQSAKINVESKFCSTFNKIIILTASLADNKCPLHNCLGVDNASSSQGNILTLVLNSGRMSKERNYL